MLGATKSLLRRTLPFRVRVGLRRLPAVCSHLLRRRPGLARVATADRVGFPFLQAGRETPLVRPTALYGTAMQSGKERNVGLGAELLDGIVVPPGAQFSWHDNLGPPMRLRGFVPGPELHGGELVAGVGGGLCQVANLVCWLAIRSGMEIVERHRHDLDLFPDHERTAPFGSGATVFHPTLDLRFVNPLPLPWLLELTLRDGALEGRARFPSDPGFRCELVETSHRFVRRSGAVWRENQLSRRVLSADATVIREDDLGANRARVLYPLPDDSICQEEST